MSAMTCYTLKNSSGLELDSFFFKLNSVKFDQVEPEMYSQNEWLRDSSWTLSDQFLGQICDKTVYLDTFSIWLKNISFFFHRR